MFFCSDLKSSFLLYAYVGFFVVLYLSSCMSVCFLLGRSAYIPAILTGESVMYNLQTKPSKMCLGVDV